MHLRKCFSLLSRGPKPLGRRAIFANVKDSLAQKKAELERLASGKAAPHAHQDPTGKSEIPGVKYILAVSSAKGGVGKSTVSVNLAISLSRLGLKVGICDGDIYGPSIPIMMNLKDIKIDTEFDEDKNLSYFIPLQNYDIKCMSMGFLTQAKQAIAWRSPLAIRAILQMFDQVRWGPDLDVLVVDFAPGTGDIQLSTVQRVNVTGAIIVTTPQPVALDDVERGIDMFNKTKVPIFGVVENMAFHKCDNCGHEDHVFGRGGAESIAGQFNFEVLQHIPLHTSIRVSGDSGKPICVSEPNSPYALAYLELAKKVRDKLKAPQTPTFVIE